MNNFKDFNEDSNYLESTVNDMISDDYKRRFIVEYKQLLYRHRKLDNMIEKYKNGNLSFEPTCPISILEKQEKIMKEYIHTLRERAKIENVELD